MTENLEAARALRAELERVKAERDAARDDATIRIGQIRALRARCEALEGLREHVEVLSDAATAHEKDWAHRGGIPPTEYLRRKTTVEGISFQECFDARAALARLDDTPDPTIKAPREGDVWTEDQVREARRLGERYRPLLDLDDTEAKP